MSSTAERGTPIYVPNSANGTSEKTQRLDDQHEGVQNYIGGCLSFAPLEETSPKAILELGCGTGAWAIQAAKQFPDAEVLAVDLSPMRPRALPSNMKFQTLDVTKSFPFEPQTFDLVHARLLCVHMLRQLPRFEDVLSRTIELVKPGGWLLLEDLENTLYDNAGLGPGLNTFFQALHRNLKNKGVNPLAPSAYQTILEASGSFSEVNVKKVVVPISRKTEDMRASALGAALKIPFQRGIQMYTKMPEILAITTEVGREAQDEISDPERNLYLNMYFTWSRKHV